MIKLTKVATKVDMDNNSTKLRFAKASLKAVATVDQRPTANRAKKYALDCGFNYRILKFKSKKKSCVSKRGSSFLALFIKYGGTLFFGSLNHFHCFFTLKQFLGCFLKLFGVHILPITFVIKVFHIFSIEVVVFDNT